MVARTAFLVDTTQSSVTLNVDGCDVYMPWSVIGRYSYPQWFSSPTADCDMTAAGYSGSSGRDCIVVNTRDGHFTTTFNEETNTLSVVRLNELKGRDLPDTWEAPSTCKIALITRVYSGSVTINAKATLGKKTRIIQVCTAP